MELLEGCSGGWCRRGCGGGCGGGGGGRCGFVGFALTEIESSTRGVVVVGAREQWDYEGWQWHCWGGYFSEELLDGKGDGRLVRMKDCDVLKQMSAAEGW